MVIYKMVCAKEVSISEAQHAMATDWIEAWNRYVPIAVSQFDMSLTTRADQKPQSSPSAKGSASHFVARALHFAVLCRAG